MRIAYILGMFPSETETFIANEIRNMMRLGFEIKVYAAHGNDRRGYAVPECSVLLRPRLLSAEAIACIVYLVMKYPLSLVKLAGLTVRLMLSCPCEAATLIRNLHTIAFFAKNMDCYEVTHIHACFLSWPACIGLAIATVTERRFSIATHARDIFVEHGAVSLKVSYAKFVTSCTQQGLQQLKGYLPAKYHSRLHLNYHGTDVSHDVAPMKAALKKTTVSEIVAVGRLVPKKGFAVLIRALALIVRKRPFVLKIVGDGIEQRKLTKLVEKLSLNEHVFFLGWQDHEA
ncbi:glycosyltransferase, partial [Candidatus Pacearchaeota archaeon]|nr:glycosyltransferase [Candidatus Pacearchaeota archaeon]